MQGHDTSLLGPLLPRQTHQPSAALLRISSSSTLGRLWQLGSARHTPAEGGLQQPDSPHAPWCNPPSIARQQGRPDVPPGPHKQAKNGGGRAWVVMSLERSLAVVAACCTNWLREVLKVEKFMARPRPRRRGACRRAGLTCTLQLCSACSARPGLSPSQPARASARTHSHTVFAGLRRSSGVRGAVMRRNWGWRGRGQPGGSRCEARRAAGRGGAEVARGAQERVPAASAAARGGGVDISCFY